MTEWAKRTEEQKLKNRERCRRFYEKNREHVKESSRRWYSENKERATKTREKYANSPKGRANALLYRAKKQSEKRRWGKPGLPFDLTIEWIESRIVANVCEATGLPFDLSNRSGAWIPFSPSVDRIDGSKGYTMDNCRVVCLIFNTARNQFSDEDVLKMANALVKKNGK
jgi:hypothetical protein